MITTKHFQSVVQHNNDNNRIQRRNLRFLTISSLHHKLPPIRTLKWPRRKSCANHVQHMECVSHATCCVVCHMVQSDSSAMKSDRV